MDPLLLVILTTLTSTALGIISNIIANRIDPHIKDRNRLVIILFGLLLGALLVFGFETARQEIADKNNRPSIKALNPLPNPKTLSTLSPSPESILTPSPSPESTLTPSPSPESTLTPSPSPEASIQALPFPLDNKKPTIENLSNKDYELLEKFLNKKEWKYADLETKNVILKVSKRKITNIKNIEDFINVSKLDRADKAYFKLQKETDEVFYPATVKIIPCDALRRIDKLWVNASNGRFGFSVQKKVYLETTDGKLDGKLDLNGFGNPWFDFAENVKWMRNRWANWDPDVPYSEYVFNTTDAPYGHLPSYIILFDNPAWGFRKDIPVGQGFYYIMFRLEQCKM